MNLWENTLPQEKLEGISLSPGIAIGAVYVLETTSPEAPKITVKKSDIDHEKRRVDEASALAYHQISKLQVKAENLPPHAAEEIILLLDAHLNMVSTSRLTRDIKTRIEDEKINAEWALEKEIQNYEKTFREMEDLYLARRGRDIRDVGRRLMRNLMGHKFVALRNVPQGGIVLSEEITSADTAFMNPRKISGFVSIVGTKQSHAAIMARSLGLPAVAAIAHMPHNIRKGSVVIIDGDRGHIIVNPTKRTLNQYEKRQKANLVRHDAIHEKAHMPAQTRDGTIIDVQANLSRPEDIEMIVESGASGIGLFRSEFMFMNRDDIPSEQEQYDHIADVIRTMNGKPVTIRTMDVGGDKTSPAFYDQVGHEANPALGLRGIRLSLAMPEILETQFRAILRAGVLGPVKILIPMVTHLEQIKQCRKILHNTMKKIHKQKVTALTDIPPLGLMIETPAAVLIADELAKECDFFSIGTNDLIQYTMAADRTNDHVEEWYQADHPAVLNLMKKTIDAANKNNIPVSLCGEMAGDTLYTQSILSLGIRTLSINAASIAIIKDIIRDIRLT